MNYKAVYGFDPKKAVIGVAACIEVNEVGILGITLSPGNELSEDAKSRSNYLISKTDPKSLLTKHLFYPTKLMDRIRK